LYCSKVIRYRPKKRKSLIFFLQPFKEYKEINPDNIHEMPVSAHQFHSSGVIAFYLTAVGLKENYQQGNDATKNMQGM
jgi:hypothetical protein